MKLPPSLDDRLDELVHPEARLDPEEAEAHRGFIATRLVLSGGVVALAPLCVAAGVSSAWSAAALTWLSLPLAAVAIVSRSGDLRLAEALSLASWIGLAVTVTVGTGSSAGLALLLMVPVELAGHAALSPRVPPVAAVLAAAGATLATWRLPTGALSQPALATAAAAAVFCFACFLALTTRRGAQRRAAAARSARERFAQLAESLDAVVMRLDRTGGVLDSTATSERLFELSGRQLAGRGLLERLLVADRPAFLKAATEAAASHEVRAVTLRLRSGRTLEDPGRRYVEPVFRHVEIVLRPCGGPAGGGEVLGLLRDVSDRVALERRLAEQRAESDRTVAARDLFLATVTHELRTPLNAIIGFAEMLKSESLAPAEPARRREYAAIVHQSGQHLLSVVNGILDATKIEAGRFDVFPEALDLARLIEECCDMVSLKAEQAGIRLARDVASGLGEIVGDPRACRQILLNLLSNALKFTSRGGDVAVLARPDGNAVLLTVSDTGIGIAARDLPSLGDPFFQVRGGYDRTADGTGLGLSIVRGLVGLHGGTIAIESEPGQGTRVFVRLPVDGRRQAPGTMTKIETIPRYSSSVRHGEAPGGGRMHRVA